MTDFRPHILFLDDSVATGMVVQAKLELVGFRVTTSVGFFDLEKIRDSGQLDDLAGAVSDFNISARTDPWETNGMDVLGLLRHLDPTIPVLLFSDDEKITREQKAQFDDCLERKGQLGMFDEMTQKLNAVIAKRKEEAAAIAVRAEAAEAAEVMLARAADVTVEIAERDRDAAIRAAENAHKAKVVSLETSLTAGGSVPQEPASPLDQRILAPRVPDRQRTVSRLIGRLMGRHAG